MSEVNFNTAVGSLAQGLEGFLSTKTVVGEPVTVNGTTIIPLVDASFFMGAGSFGKGKDNAGGAMTGKMEPSAILIIKDGSARVMNVKDQDAVSRLMDIAPNIVDRISSLIKGKKDPEVDAAVENAMKTDK